MQKNSRYHILTWCYDTGEDGKGDFSSKAHAVQVMRHHVLQNGSDGAAVIDRTTHRPIAVYGCYPRFSFAE